MDQCSRAWRCFGSRKDAAKAFGVAPQDVSELVRNVPHAKLRGLFEAQPARAPPKKCERPTKAAPPKKKLRRVEGAHQKQNGKWANQQFPGREFESLDEFRAAKKQRAARREEYRAQYQ